MKKLTKKEKAQFPEFIVNIDMSYKGNAEFKDAKGYHRGYYTKAMEEKDILSAMKRMDKVIREHGNYFYLVDILGKTGRENEEGRPIYETKIRCRINLSSLENEDGSRDVIPAQWHFCDAEHSESNDYEFLWYAHEDRYGWLEYIKKSVS